MLVLFEIKYFLKQNKAKTEQEHCISSTKACLNFVLNSCSKKKNHFGFNVAITGLALAASSPYIIYLTFLLFAAGLVKASLLILLIKKEYRRRLKSFGLVRQPSGSYV